MDFINASVLAVVSYCDSFTILTDRVISKSSYCLTSGLLLLALSFPQTIGITYDP